MVSDEIGPTESDPLVARDPLHPPLAVQFAAFTLDQLSIALPPLITLVGVAEKLRVGAGVVTVTVALCTVVPPAPLQVSVYVVVALSGPTVSDPLSVFDPDQPSLAVQLVASSTLQLRSAVLPDVMLDGFAVSEMVGADIATAIDALF